MKLRLFKALLAVVAVTALAGRAEAGTALTQCANGPLATPVDCTEANGAWITGNIGSSKGHYAEGEVVPYRLYLTGIGIGAGRTATIEWDTTKGGTHATDYISSFDVTETTADPCTGAAGVPCGAPTMFPIPLDPNLALEGFVGPIIPGGMFTIYGGTITGVSVYSLSGLYTGDSGPASR